jgi:peptide deformylase
MIQPILTMGNPLLYKRAETVPMDQLGSIDTMRVIQDMEDTVKTTLGSGIAAPQIGVSKRIIVFGYDKVKNYPQVEPVPHTILINPEFVAIEPEDKLLIWEHCLSIPKMRGKTLRFNKIRYWGYTPDGDKIERLATGVHAILVQHEIDHLNGVLFNQRVVESNYFGFIKEFEAANIPLEMMSVPPHHSA